MTVPQISQFGGLRIALITLDSILITPHFLDSLLAVFIPEYLPSDRAI